MNDKIKKKKLTVSGFAKRTSNPFNYAAGRNKTSVLIEKRTTRHL